MRQNVTNKLQYGAWDVKIKAAVNFYSNIIKGDYLWTVATELKRM